MGVKLDRVPVFWENVNGIKIWAEEPFLYESLIESPNWWIMEDPDWSYDDQLVYMRDPFYWMDL